MGAKKNKNHSSNLIGLLPGDIFAVCSQLYFAEKENTL